MAVLGGATLALIAAVLIGVYQFGNLLAPLVPFAWEKPLGDGMVKQWAKSPGNAETGQYLRTLTNRLAAVMDLPDGMTITVHYVHGETVNAFATLGGNVVVFDALLNKLPSENGLAMVLAHEIAHVKYRHVVRAMGGGILVSLVSSALFGDTGFAGSLAGGGGMLTALHFSREKEEQADGEALAALMAVYGHVNGFDEIFRLPGDGGGDGGARSVPVFLSSHPLTGPRIRRLQRIAGDRGWPVDGEVAPLDP